MNFFTSILNLGASFNVNPLIFAGIYIGAIPFFLLSTGLLVRRYRERKSLIVPTVLAGFFFLSAYLYVFIFGENLPLSFYVILVGWIIIGVIINTISIRRRLASVSDEQGPSSIDTSSTV